MTGGLGRVVVVGQGYVGLPLAIRAAEVGYHVFGVDSDRHRANRLSAGDSFVSDVSNDRLRASLASGRYVPTTDLRDVRDFAYAVITVPTPLTEGAPDLSFIDRAAREIAPFICRGSAIVLESTTYPGTTEERLVPLLEEGSGLAAGVDFHVGYSPERIDPGNPVWTLENTPKVVSGVNASSAQHVADFYATLVSSVVPVSSPKEAELAKLLENTFRHVNIALVNELAIFASDLGIDIHEAVDAASTKPFGFMRFTPGPGVGGHCLPVDPSYLSWQVRQKLGRSFRFVELANDVNDHMPDYVVGRVISILNNQRKAVMESRILIVGLAYKKNTSDMRESPALRIVELLQDLGADLRVVEPYADMGDVPVAAPVVDLTGSEAEEADLVILLTDHDRIDLCPLEQFKHKVFDTRRALKGAIQL